MFEHLIVNGQKVTYNITDQLAKRQWQIARWQRGEGAARSLGMPCPRELTKADCYPKDDTYQFQEFAGFVFELGGYGDMSMIDPYSLKRLWVGDALEMGNIYDAMRHVIAVAEALDFPTTPDTEGFDNPNNNNHNLEEPK